MKSWSVARDRFLKKLMITLPALCSLGASAAAYANPALLHPRVFDAEFYHQRYPDLRSAFKGDRTKLQEHWQNALAKGETREAHPNFSPSAYLNRYHDLRAAFGTNLAAATQHYIQYGIAEGRNGAPNNVTTWGQWMNTRGANAEIPEDMVVVLDRDANVGGLTIRGTLRCADKDLNLSARWILVYGRLECGTLDDPYLHKLTVTLTSANESEDVKVSHTHDMGGHTMKTEMSVGTKFIVAAAGGVISLHGRPANGWVSLARTAQPGGTMIELATARQKADWRVGDQIIITATRPMKASDPGAIGGSAGKNLPEINKENEIRTIRSITPINGGARTQVVLDEPLKFGHFGEIQTFDNGRSDGKKVTWQVDTRAEVGLLTRNILIQGDEASEASQIGAHMMVMDGSQGYVRNVQLQRVGQAGIVGRYPFHWHMAGDVSGRDVGSQYFSNNSIIRSFSRCVTVHGSHRATIANNVCYDHRGHGMFLEDGVETGNLFERNLVIWTRRPEKPLRESDTRFAPPAKGPAAFYISNGNNRFVGNVAVSAEGSGFWYHTEKESQGESMHRPEYAHVKPITSPFGEFSGNRVHNSRTAFSSCNEKSGALGYTPPGEGAIYRNFTVFSTGGPSLWPCRGKQTFAGLKVLDSGFHNGSAAFVAPSPMYVHQGLFAAKTRLGDPTQPPIRRHALGLYDFGVRFINSSFQGYGQANASMVAGGVGAAGRNTESAFFNVTLPNSDRFFAPLPKGNPFDPVAWGEQMRDADGTSFGAPGTLVREHPMMFDERTCPSSRRWKQDPSNRFCPGVYYASMYLDFGSGGLPEIALWRTDKASNRFPVSTNQKFPFHRDVIATNQRYRHAYDMSAVVSQGRREMKLKLYGAKPNHSVMMEFHGLPAGAQVMNMQRANSEQALIDSRTPAYFVANPNAGQGKEVLMVKLFSRGTEPTAVERLVKW